jgi:branched-chain amino acid transport system ATP-binding protein
LNELLTIDGLHVSYGRVAAVRGLSMVLHKQEVVGVLGANGAGKSTTFAAIAGLIAPANGRVILNGEDITGKSPEQIVRRGLSLVPEGRRIFTSLTVEENLAVAANATGHSAKSIAEVWDRFPTLKPLRSLVAGKLSGGQQQLLAIGRALVTGPTVLLMDEPSLGLAPMMVSAVFKAIEDLRSEGASILLAEQFVNKTLAVADRVYVLNKGLVAISGSAADVRSSSDFHAHYLLGGGV